MKMTTVFLGVLLSLSADHVCAEEVSAPVTRLALFKNGLAAVTRDVKLPDAGSHVLTLPVRPLHGTLWFSPVEGLTVRAMHSTMPENPRVYTPSWSSHYAPAPRTQAPDDFAMYRSCPVTVTYNGGSVSGTLLDTPDTAWIRIKRKEDGAVFSLRSSGVISISALETNPETKKKTGTSFQFQLARKSEKPVRMDYLTKGISWAPAYRVQFLPDSRMNLVMSAVIINDLEDIKDVNVDLVSGFPNLQFANVQSPLGGLGLDNFLRQLQNPGRSGYASAVTQQVMLNHMVPGNAGDDDFKVASQGDGENMQYREAGLITLKKGESLYMTLESKETGCERLVEWSIPDNRDNHGHYQNRNNREKEQTLWEAVRFKNPMNMAMTTAPVEFFKDNRILGQTTGSWVNPGQTALLHITKALTVSGVHHEQEVNMNRPHVQLDGRRYRNPDVQADFTLVNYSNVEKKVLVRLNFSGKLISADANPSAKRLTSGLFSVNPGNELNWELTLKPGETKKINYRYSVLVTY